MAASEAVGPRSGGVLSSLAADRGRLYAGAVGLVIANAVAGKVIETIGQSGPAAALVAGLGFSWAFWFAFAVAVGLALREPAAPARPRDLAVCAAAVLAALFPLSQVAAVACTGLAAAILIDRVSGRHLRAAAMVLMAISVQILWARLLMLFFVQPIATLDAHVVSLVIDRPVHGHDVLFADGSHTLSILAGCTSVQNASIALVLYVAVVRAFRPEPRRFEVLALAGVFASVVALNVARLALMAQSITLFHLVHDGVGAGVVNAIITATGLAWAVGSVRHEIFDPPRP